ncbi:VanZ family protein [Streptomyces sp. NPDC058382]|uniref:VanZ family protein n=1 Tax=unclassified Streptomyces TaxID=2593676 RepID=UPI003644981E
MLALLAMVGFSVVLAKVTLTPSPASEELVKSNLRPGRSLRQYAEDYTFLAACKQAGGNLVLGMPFGVLVPILVPRRMRMIRMILLTVVVIALVELVQGALVAGRAFDVDDVILNTTGALLGYLLLGRRLSHRYHVLAAGREQPEPAPEPTSAAKPPVRDGRAPARRPWRGAWTRLAARGTPATAAEPKAGTRKEPGTKTGTRPKRTPKQAPKQASKPKQTQKPKQTPKPAAAGAKSRAVPKSGAVPKPRAASKTKSAAATGGTARGEGARAGSFRTLLDRFRSR